MRYIKVSSFTTQYSVLSNSVHYSIILHQTVQCTLYCFTLQYHHSPHSVYSVHSNAVHYSIIHHHTVQQCTCILMLYIRHILIFSWSVCGNSFHRASRCGCQYRCFITRICGFGCEWAPSGATINQSVHTILLHQSCTRVQIVHQAH